MDEDWKTPEYRQNVVSKLDEAIKAMGIPSSESAAEMEDYFFLKSRCREEYLAFIIRIIIRSRNTGREKRLQCAECEASRTY